jgi:hypothetical protein
VTDFCPGLSSASAVLGLFSFFRSCLGLNIPDPSFGSVSGFPNLAELDNYLVSLQNILPAVTKYPLVIGTSWERRPIRVMVQ